MRKEGREKSTEKRNKDRKKGREVRYNYLI